jgi:hypothetical protein
MEFVVIEEKREREISETREKAINFRVFRLFRVFRVLSWLFPTKLAPTQNASAINHT